MYSCDNNKALIQRRTHKRTQPVKRTKMNRGLKNWNAYCKCVRIWLVAWDTAWQTLQPPVHKLLK